MKPSPVGIDGDFAVDIGTAGAAFACAALPCHLWVGLGLLFANQLGGGSGSREEGRYGLESERRHHLVTKSWLPV